MQKFIGVSALLLVAIAAIAVQPAQAAGKSVYCYWGTWSHYRPGNGKFEVSRIQPKLCTHLGYAFLGLGDNMEIKTLDPWLDLELGMMDKTVALKNQNPNLKVLASVGGWGEGSEKYSRMARDAGSRNKFITSTIELLRRHGFDGLDLDWEYPAQRGGSWDDRVNYVTLLRELKTAMRPWNLILTAAVAATQASAEQSYDIPAISQYLDIINIMTYDFNGAWEQTTGFNAPLYGQGPNTAEASIDYWLRSGAPASKILMGIPFYGRTFTLSNPSQSYVGAPVTGAGQSGPYTRENGFLGYNEICTFVNGWTKEFDQTSKVPYAYSGNQWVGYDNPESIKYKVDFIKSRNLGGGMIWSLETDDFLGECGQSYPLLRAVNDNL